MVRSWDRKVRRILEIAGEDRGELLQRILLALGEHEHSGDAPLVDFGATEAKVLTEIAEYDAG